MHTHTNTAASN